MKNGNGEMVASVANLVTEALLESLPDSIRSNVERAIAGFAGEVHAIVKVQAGIVAKVAMLERELAESKTREETLRKELVQADANLSTTLETLTRGVPTMVEGALAAAVAALPTPAAGRDGKDGAPGMAGAPGHDAVFLRPIPWTEGRVYARGSLVQRHGGVWQADTDTEQEPGAKLSGWALIQDGMLPLRSELDSRGWAQIVYRTASGLEWPVALGFRPWQYAGLYDAARTYQPNDVLTDDGGIWLALSENASQRPGTPDTGHVWKLIQKRPKDGRDGHDGKAGRDGVNGAPGPAGHAGASIVNVLLSAGGMLETTLSDGRVLTQLTPFTTNKRKAAERSS